jgi:hypothetical protein
LQALDEIAAAVKDLEAVSSVIDGLSENPLRKHSTPLTTLN